MNKDVVEIVGNLTKATSFKTLNGSVFSQLSAKTLGSNQLHKPKTSMNLLVD
jgi:hypothetical protein